MISRSEEHGEVIPAIRRLSRCGRATAATVAVDKDLAGADTGERRPCSTWLASASSEVSGMSAPDVVAARLNGQVLAPAGSNLVLAEWVAQASVGDEPLYQAPLHLHEEDEAWYVLEGTLRVWVGDDQVEVPAGERRSCPVARLTPFGTPALSPRAMCWSWGPGRTPSSRPSMPAATGAQIASGSCSKSTAPGSSSSASRPTACR